MTSRRTFLVAASGLAVAVAVPRASANPARLPADPFTLGVASGDPSPDGVVLWTRLATDPTAADGGGGMPPRPVDVEWELAHDAAFTDIARRGTAVAAPRDGHSVHVELSGLAPGRDFHYRFRTAGYLSPAGRTRTAPEPWSSSPLLVCVASCAQYEHGWFTAYRGIADDHPDVVLHLGDYSYEDAGGEYVAASGNIRTHAGPETVDLAGYRQRYAQYKTDPDLQAAHAAAPWLTVFDDHEVQNNWAADVPEEPQPDFPARRAAAMRAYWENMPLRRSAIPVGTALQLYRRVGWGATATFHMLDTRQYRDDQACDDRFGSDCPELTDPARSITGGAQEAWLLDGLRTSSARWDVLGQQVFFSRIDLTPGPARGYNPDAWDGYAANRQRVVAGLRDSAVRNAVVFTGDVHSHWAAEIHEAPDDLSSTRVGCEFVTTSITSGGDGDDGPPALAPLEDNPHIRFACNRRGYLRTRFDAAEARTDFRVVPYVSRLGAPVETRASFAVVDGDPTLHRL